ncbi:MAG: hypothetical protein AB7P14_20900 [Blastocatellales bacterium]
MFCPKCGVHAGPDGSRFCRSCGFRLDGVAQLLARNGALDGTVQAAPPSTLRPTSPRQKGIRKGGKIVFSAIALFPIFFGLCFLVDGPGPLIVPTFLFFAGLMRILYARLFEDDYAQSTSAVQQGMVVAPQPIPVLSAYQPQVVQPQLHSNAPTTGNLAEPQSVTEQTTNLLNRS